MIKPPFGYPGSKIKQLKNILPHIPYLNRYVEVFGGTGSVLLNRDKSRFEIFNDKYSGITSFYKCLQDQGKLDQLVEKIMYTVHSREFWGWCKDTWEDQDDLVNRAFRWFYTTKYSFGQIGRNFGRSTGISNGDSGKIIRSCELFNEINLRLRNVLIENLNYKKCILDYASKQTVFYLDPPYLDTDNYAYNKHFTDDDHIELLRLIKNNPGYYVVSSYPNALYDKCTFWTNVIEWKTEVTLDQTSRKSAIERLYISDATS